MNRTSNPATPAISELIELELDRNKLLIAQDFERLAAIFDDDLLFVHANGLVQNKTAFLALVKNVVEFVSAERSDLKIRQYDKVAVMTGILTAEVRKRGAEEITRMVTFVTQVWLLSDAGWKLVSFQSTQAPAQ